MDGRIRRSDGIPLFRRNLDGNEGNGAVGIKSTDKTTLLYRSAASINEINKYFLFISIPSVFFF